MKLGGLLNKLVISGALTEQPAITAQTEATRDKKSIAGYLVEKVLGDNVRMWDLKPADNLQRLSVTLLKEAADRERITLSIKALQSDPWTGIAQRYTPESKVNGTVVRLAPFGAFVNLETGVDGLIHISNLGAGRRINHPKEVIQVGQQIEAYVLAVDPQNKKISLSLQPKPKPKEVVLPKAGELLEGTVEKVMPYGVFLKISDDVTGLIPNAEMDTPIGTDHSKMFPAGTQVKVVVLDADAKSGKLRLSRKGIEERAEKAEYLQYRESVKKENQEEMGTLGKLLKQKMEEKGFTV